MPEQETMKVQNENYAQELTYALENSNFISDVGIKCKDFGPGWCESTLQIQEKHLQHTNIVHAGVLATMLDNTAGAAAFTLLPAGVSPITIEFKLNLLRPATGEIIECKSQVLKAGSKFTVVESEAFCFIGTEKKLVSKATVTIVGVS